MENITQLFLSDSAKRIAILFFSLIGLTALIAWWQVKIPSGQDYPLTEDQWALPALPQSTKVQEEAAITLRKRSPWGPEEAALSENEQKRNERIEAARKRNEEAKKRAELAKKAREDKEQQKELERQKAKEERERLAEQRRLEEEQRRLEEERRRAEEQKRQQRQQLKQNFVGILQQGEQAFILLLENNHTTRYALGSNLPGYGVSLAGIHKDFIEVQRGDEIEVVALYNDEHLKKQRPVSEFMLKQLEPKKEEIQEETVKEEEPTKPEDTEKKIPPESNK